MRFVAKIAIVIVGFRNATDITDCLRALARLKPEPGFEIFIAENGGPAAMDALMKALVTDGSPCASESEPEFEIESSVILRCRLLRLVGPDLTPRCRVHVAEMAENLGYAGAINAWLRPLLQVQGWEGAWILNPDTEPTPTALAELVACSIRRGKGMVGSCTTSHTHPEIVRSRGLAWQKLAARTLAVDYHAPITVAPDPEDVESRLSAPSGASFYVTRDLIDQIGLMDERYFLYFEDLEWGCRAKRLGEVGYAHRSVVRHKGGTTTGSAGSRATSSPLSVYLEIRNRILFVRDQHPAWLLWTILMQTVHALSFGAVGAFRNMVVGFEGLLAGVSGEVGRPDRMLKAHKRSPELGA